MNNMIKDTDSKVDDRLSSTPLIIEAGIPVPDDLFDCIEILSYTESRFDEQATEYIEHIQTLITKELEVRQVEPSTVFITGYSSDDEGHSKNVESVTYSAGIGSDDPLKADHIDDSTAHNLAIKAVEEKRAELKEIAKTLEEDLISFNLTAERREQLKQHIAELRSQIDEEKTALEKVDSQLYYFTKIDELMDTNPEDNPISYATEYTKDDDTDSFIAVYDGQAISDAGHDVSFKSDKQIRVAINGDDLDKYCLFRIKLVK